MLDYYELKNEIKKRNEFLVDKNLGKVYESVIFLKEEIEKSKDENYKNLLFHSAIDECIRSKNKKAELFFLILRLEKMQPNPIFLGAVSIFFAFEGNEEKCFKYAKYSIELAKKENRQIRHCYTFLARNSILLGNYEKLAEALEGLIADKDNTRKEDLNYQFDFLEQIDRKKIKSILLEEYTALNEKHIKQKRNNNF